MQGTATSYPYLTWKVRQWLVSGVCLGGLLFVVALPLNHAVERQPIQSEPHTSEVTPAAQKHFLQHFISRSLQPEVIGQEATVTPKVMPEASASPAATTPPSLAVLEPQAHELTAAATKMVLSLGILVVLLIAGAYLVRRYLLPQTPLGRRGPLLRVIAKVPLTPKTAVALVEVPGKVLVVGITGTTLTALGEVEPTDLEPQAQEAGTTTSFTAILDQRTHEEQQDPDDAVLHVPESIQKKVSELKRL